jgi:hypothetical protein
MKARYQQKLSVPGTAILADPAGDGQATTNEEQREQPPKDLNDRSRAAEIFDRIRREQAI